MESYSASDFESTYFSSSEDLKAIESNSTSDYE
jgi:hypothetical protein